MRVLWLCSSVQRSLEHLAEWRAAQSSSPTPRAGLGLSSVLAQQQDKVLFKVRFEIL